MFNGKLQRVSKFSNEIGINRLTFVAWLKALNIPYCKGPGKRGGIYITDEAFQEVMRKVRRN